MGFGRADWAMVVRISSAVRIGRFWPGSPDHGDAIPLSGRRFTDERPMSDLTPDHTLDATLAAAASGDGDAWRRLVDAYAPRVFALVLRQCGDRELSEEIAQATFVKVVTHLSKYNEQGRFEPWLFRIAMNKLRDEMRRQKRQARPMDMSPGSAPGSTSSREGGGQWAAVNNNVAGDKLTSATPRSSN